uniref:Uncharacterized protein n=1 Tax=Nelumbo nucifera TaxID=4432 RepID=A0A822Z4T8_NELNU|nr:TPA_asm: hypothetical protein HUJ06_007189 [Nelumbo nucifera]
MEEAYHKALELEKFQRLSTFHRMSSQARGQAPKTMSKSVSFQRTNRPTQPEPTMSSGHVASRCPNRILTIGTDVEESFEGEDVEQVVESLEEPSDTEFEEDQGCIDDHHLSVMRCILSTPTETDDWKRTSTFQAYFKCGDVVCKVVIDGGSSINVVSKSAISRMKLKPEPHPQPYRVA